MLVEALLIVVLLFPLVVLTLALSIVLAVVFLLLVPIVQVVLKVLLLSILVLLFFIIPLLLNIFQQIFSLIDLILIMRIGIQVSWVHVALIVSLFLEIMLLVVLMRDWCIYSRVGSDSLVVVLLHEQLSVVEFLLEH